MPGSISGLLFVSKSLPRHSWALGRSVARSVIFVDMPEISAAGDVRAPWHRFTGLSVTDLHPKLRA